MAHSGIAKKNRKTHTRVKPVVQLGLTFVSIDDLQNHKWRAANMFDFPHSVLAARLMNLLGPK